jgi:hypothetical protein
VSQNIRSILFSHAIGVATGGFGVTGGGSRIVNSTEEGEGIGGGLEVCINTEGTTLSFQADLFFL